MRNTHDPGRATMAQRERAHKLGVTIPPDATVQEASRILDAAGPSQEQLALAQKLGIRGATQMTGGALSRALREANSRQGMAALRSNPALRESALIVLNDELFRIERIWRNPRKPSVTLRRARGGRAKVVAAASLAHVREVNPKHLPER